MTPRSQRPGDLKRFKKRALEVRDVTVWRENGTEGENLLLDSRGGKPLRGKTLTFTHMR